METVSKDIKSKISFWIWFFKGSGGKPGFQKLFDKWILLHIVLGVGLAIIVPVELKVAAAAVLLPLAGIFVGLSFAWAGNAVALLQTKEINELSKYLKGGYSEYVFVFQLAILTIISCLVLWGIAGLEVFDRTWPTQCRSILYFAVKVTLYCISSMTMRECWNVVVGAQSMLLIQREIKNIMDVQKEDNSKR